MPVVNFDFNGQITHGGKLRFHLIARKRGFFKNALAFHPCLNQIVLECLRSFGAPSVLSKHIAMLPIIMLVSRGFTPAEPDWSQVKSKPWGRKG